MCVIKLPCPEVRVIKLLQCACCKMCISVFGKMVMKYFVIITNAVSYEQQKQKNNNYFIHLFIYFDLQSLAHHSSLFILHVTWCEVSGMALHVLPVSTCPPRQCPLRAIMMRSACGGEHAVPRYRGHIWGWHRREMKVAGGAQVLGEQCQADSMQSGRHR